VSECDFAVSLLKSKTSVENVSSIDPNHVSVDVTNEPQQLSHSIDAIQLTSTEKNALGYLIEWLAFKLKTQLKSCKTCADFLVSSNSDDRNAIHTRLIAIKSYEWLTFFSLCLQKVILAAECIFHV
jgi:hypothetical protein